MRIETVTKISGLTILPIAFMFLFGRYGLEDADSGFLLGMGWRIINSEIPYFNFYYIRPPLSPYITSLLLLITPEFGQVFWLRLINYYQLLVQIILTLLIFRKYYDFKALAINFYIFAAVCFLITSTGTLYFQWHTTDGIFLAVLACYLIITFHNKSMLMLVLAGLVLGCSSLTKQNYLIIPIVTLIFTLLQFGIKKSLYTAMGIILSALIFAFVMLNSHLWGLFLSQTTGSTQLRDIFYSSFLNYFNVGDFIFGFSVLFCVMLLSFVVNPTTNMHQVKRKSFILLLLSLSIFNSILFLAYGTTPFSIPFDRITPVILIITYLYLVYIGKEDFKTHYVTILLLLISWSSSISWGGMSPIMYFTPILFFSYYLLQRYWNLFDRKANIVLVAIICLYSFIANSKPYRDEFIWNIDQDAGIISDKLAFIKASDIIIEKHTELQKIFQSYPEASTTILPSMPGAYYINGYKNYFSIDWAMDAEAAFDRDGLIQSLNSCCDLVFLEKRHFGQEIGQSGKFYSSISDYVKNNYRTIDTKYKFFNIYKKPTSYIN